MVPSPTIYAGPGDIVSGAAGWWGLRAYTLASIGSNAIRLRENGGNTESDFATIAGGGLNLSAISTFKGANSLFVTKLYEQSGSGADFIQATAGNQPAFTLNGLGSLPIMDFTNNGFMIAGLGTVNQIFTISVVAKTNGGAAQQSILVGVGGSTQLSFDLAGSHQNTMFIFAGGPGASAPATDGNWHAAQGVFNSATSTLMIDGSDTTGLDASTQAFTAGGQLGFDTVNHLNGYITEAGIWPTGFSNGNRSNMNSNQRAYWGF